MSRRQIPVLLLLPLLLSGGAPARAATDAPAEGPPAETAAPFDWSVTSASRYCFEGFDYSAGRAVVQPQGSLTWKRCEFGFWGNGDPARGELNEVDLSAQTDWEHGAWSADLGYQHLHYPHRDWSATSEVFADLALAGPLNPSLSIHRDVDAGNGAYTTLGLAHDLPGHGTTLGLAAKLYVHDHYYGLSGIPALETNVALAQPVGGITVRPMLQRFWTWENRDFRGAEALAPTWVLSVAIGSK